jgi:hypothetical protein
LPTVVVLAIALAVESLHERHASSACRSRALTSEIGISLQVDGHMYGPSFFLAVMDQCLCHERE